MKGKKCKIRLAAWLLAAVMICSSVLSPVGASAAKKSKPKLNKKKVSVQVGKTVKLKVKKKPKGKKVKWSSNKKKIASVNNKGLVKGKKQGTAKITAKVGGKKLTCTVKVKAKENVEPTEPEVPVPTDPEAPVQTTPPAAQETGKPTSTAKETDKPTNAPTDTPEPTPPAEVQSTPKSDVIVQEPTIPPMPQMEPTPEPIPTYQVTIQVKRDGQDWTNSGKSFYLKKSGGDYTESLMVENGTYEVYERGETGDTNTGKSVTVQNAAASVAVDYYTVTYMDGTSRMTKPAQVTVLSGSKITKPTEYDYKENHRLEKWVTQDGGNTEFNFEGAITGKTSVYAKWTEDITAVSYTVKYYLENANGQYIESADMKEANVGGTTSQTVTPKNIEGYTLNTTRGSGQNTAVLTGPNMTFEFYYDRKSYTITWNGTFSGGATQKTETKKFGTSFTAPSDAVQQGYTLTWNPPLPSVMPAQNVTYTARYTLEVYSISYGLKDDNQLKEYKTYERLDDSQGAIKGTYTVEDNTFTLPQASKIGYDFVGWTGSNGTTPQKVVTISKGSVGNKSYTPNWTPKNNTPYTVKHCREDSLGTYNTLVEEQELEGTTLATIRPPVKTYKGFTSPAVREDIVRVDHTTIIYYYPRNSYKITWKAGGGEINGADYIEETKKYEADITPPVASRQGYTFAGWGETVPQTMPAGNLEYTAQWTKSSYTVELSLKLDNQTWSAAVAASNKKTFSLYSGSSKAADFQIANGVYQATLKSGGTYQLYEGSKKTNISINVSGQNVTQEVKYWTLSYYNEDNKSEKLGQQYVLNGEYPTEPIMVKVGYYVQQWYNSDGRYYYFDYCPAVTSTTSVYAEFSPETYYLNLDLGMDISDSYINELSSVGIDCYDDIYYYDYDTKSAYLPKPKRSNYTFLGWTGANGSTPQLEVNVRDVDLLKKGVKDEDDCIYFTFKANWKSNITSTKPFINPTKDILSVNSKKAALTMPVNQLVNSGWAGDQVREGITPQGYTSYIYYDKNYNDYFVVYLSDERVVGMATMSRNFQYKYTNSDTVSYGGTVPSSFKNMSKYNYSGAYYYDAGDAYVMVHTDQISSNQGRIYALQVFAKTVTVNGVTKTYSSLDDLIMVEKLVDGYPLKQSEQSEAVCRSMADELLDWASAYRATVSGKSPFKVWGDNSQSSAQMECDQLSGKTSVVNGTLMDKYENMYGVMLPSWIGQTDGERSPDAFGFFTWWLDNKSPDTQAKLYAALTKTPEVDEYYACAGYSVVDKNGKPYSYAVLHFVHP